MPRLLAGLLAGCFATAPMSLVMQLAHRFPRREHHALPLQQITKKLAWKFGVRHRLDESQLQAVTLANHFGFGAAAGGFYALTFGKIKAPAPLKGAFWGLMIWMISYLGWVPAARILPPATRHSARRNGLMIGAHLVWGVVMAVLAERIETPQSTP